MPSAPLVVRAFDPRRNAEESWTCNFDDSGTIDNLRNECTGVSRGARVPLMVTPTYWSDAYLWAVTNSVPMTAPLQWSVDLDASAIPADSNVYIEFSLKVLTGKALTSVDNADLGRKRVGRTVGRSILLTNFGDAVTRIDKLELVGPNRDDFRYRVLEKRLQKLEVSVEISEQPGGILTVELADSARDQLSLFESHRGAIESRLELHSPVETALAIAIADRQIEAARAANPRFTPTESASVTATVNPRFRENPVVRRSGESLLFTKPLPFTVAPGESVEIFLTMTPSAPGPRRAELRIDIIDEARTLRGMLVSSIFGYGLQGPALVMFPATTIVIPRPHRPNSTESAVLLINNGDMAASRMSIAINGPDARRFTLLSAHAAEREILPGSDERFQLKLRNRCAAVAFSAADSTTTPAWHASLDIDTDEGQLSVELVGLPMDCNHDMLLDLLRTN
ncbi:MAG: hypothetical protein E2O84_06640 [Bacteroidetes bacterium]|nr:MAG: hypothetical protein E2O84_06640 [Bacteroidota bacterium]